MAFESMPREVAKGTHLAEDMDLDDVWGWCRDILENGAPLDLTDETRACLSRAAQQVAISAQDADDALRALSTTTTLLREIHQRIGEGSQRLDRARNDAMSRMTRLRDAGSLEAARQQLRDVLAVEVVPQYRRMAEEQLTGLDSPPPGS